MEKFRELSFEEMQEADGGGFPLLLLAGAVELCGAAIGAGCALLAGDIILNFKSYSEQLNNKLKNC